MTTITLDTPVPKSFPTNFVDLNELKNALFQHELETTMERAKNSTKDKFVNL